METSIDGITPASNVVTGDRVVQEFMTTLYSALQEDATGAVYTVARSQDSFMTMVRLSVEEATELAEKAQISPECLNAFELIMIDSGNCHGDSWKATLFPRENVFCFTADC